MAIRRENQNLSSNENSKEHIGIKYNPYTYEVTLFGSSIPLEKNSKTNLIMGKYTNKPLYLWYKELVKALYEDFNTKNFKITFHGRENDYSDILDEISYLNNNNNWNLRSELIPFNENQTIIKELSHYIDDVLATSPDELKKELKESCAIEEFNFSKNEEAEVSVIATMSSGKSTLLNAILGDEILPSKNEACTATICRIKDVDGMNGFKLKVEDFSGNIISDWKLATQDDINTFNNSGYGVNLFIEGDIPCTSSEEMSLVLIDTPGPNNSQNLEHKEATYNFIKDTTKNPLVLYVLNVTQLSTNDDARLLREISEIVKNNGKQAEERFIFALNRIDDFDVEKESIDTLIENSKKYLKDFGIENPRIFPVSAEAAKLLRLKKAGKPLTKSQSIKLAGFEFKLLPIPEENYSGIDTIKYASISNSLKEKLYKECLENKELALLHYSGITAIEKYINMYVNKYARSQQIKDSITTLKNVIDTAFLEVNLLKGKTSNEISKLSQEIKNIEQLLKTQGKDKTISVKNKIRDLTFNSEEYILLFNKIEDKFTDLEDQFNNDKATVSRAQLLLEDVNKELEELILSLHSSVLNFSEKEIRNKADNIILDLKNYFSNILNDFTLNIDLKELLESKFQLELPKISQLLNSGIYCVEEKVGSAFSHEKSVSVWYKPWTWGDTEDVYVDIYDKKEYVNLITLKSEFLTTKKREIRKMISDMENKAISQLNLLKEDSLKIVSNVEYNIELKLTELKNTVDNQNNLLQQENEYQKKIHQISLYKEKLDSILDL